ncbi:class I SAM-dependent methyltransferase [Methylibium sp.]|uniref:class I SAM-dependent methyltransferase n=1 Tax=Methylibium sp. TaxID=2067992 RepID=UPI0017D00F52|nr:class I SAM-dependent methyltransferase [Methylibium sp.]MBA3589963.1 class I SAM-dependent methyltransferase [Methylibium sp.]
MNDLAALYVSIYRDPAHATYGRGLTRCAEFLPRIWSANLEWVLSLGCGHGDELVAISGRVPHCVGVDFALPPCVWYDFPDRSLTRVQGDITEPDLLPGWDAVVSFDVFEHLREADLDPLLRNIASVTPRACLVVANMPDPHRLPDGRAVDLHLIQQPPAWWQERIASATGWRVEVQALGYPQRFGLWCGAWP